MRRYATYQFLAKLICIISLLLWNQSAILVRPSSKFYKFYLMWGVVNLVISRILVREISVRPIIPIVRALRHSPQARQAMVNLKDHFSPRLPQLILVLLLLGTDTYHSHRPTNPFPLLLRHFHIMMKLSSSEYQQTWTKNVRKGEIQLKVLLGKPSNPHSNHLTTTRVAYPRSSEMIIQLLLLQ